jgi:hypothetical protein
MTTLDVIRDKALKLTDGTRIKTEEGQLPLMENIAVQPPES